MTELQNLLLFMVSEIVNNERYILKDRLVNIVCVHSLNIDKKSLEIAKTYICNEDERMFYVRMYMKNGIELTIPVGKKYVKDKRFMKLKTACFS